jgi:glycolate oxidase FAD binding subunit
MRALAGARGIPGQPPDLAGPPGDRPGHPARATGFTGTALRVAFWVTHLADMLSVLRAAAAECGLDPDIGGSAGAGVLDVQVAGDAAADAVIRFVAAVRAGLEVLAVPAGPPAVASAVVVSAPAGVREAVDMWGPVPSPGLMRGIKDQFDPEHRMAPGRFAGGI